VRADGTFHEVSTEFSIPLTEFSDKFRDSILSTWYF